MTTIFAICGNPIRSEYDTFIPLSDLPFCCWVMGYIASISFRKFPRLIEIRWGWHTKDFMNVYLRLMDGDPCYGNMSARHYDVFNAIGNPQDGEEHRAHMLHQLLDPPNFNSTHSHFKTIGEVKQVYGDRAQQKLTEMSDLEESLQKLYSLFDPDTFNDRLPKSLGRMDKVLQLMNQYEAGRLERKSWAERMQSRNMRHFFEEDFYESWYNLVVNDLEQKVLKTIQQLEEELPKFQRKTFNASALITGSVLLFEDSNQNHITALADFLDDSLPCTFNHVRNKSAQMLREFKRAMYDLQSAQVALFRKELPEYLNNFEFGAQFVKENFAQVNIFFHKMNIEHWSQEPTYSIWSLFCDIGGALGLFLGASLLTIIEVIYFIFHNKRVFEMLTFWRKSDRKLSTKSLPSEKPKESVASDQRRESKAKPKLSVANPALQTRVNQTQMRSSRMEELV